MSTMLLTAAATGYSALIAGDARLVEAAQRLRYRVFAEELGAQLDPTGIDQDDFDAYCDHLIVREDRTGEVVGTYRLLSPQRAIWLGRRYGDGEFDLSALTVLRDQLVEAGRSCVHPDHRTGAVINLMWAGIAKYLDRFGYRWLGGCASVPLDTADKVWDLVQRKHMSPPELRVKPHLPWSPVSPVRPGSLSDVPSLLRGYLRLGAWVCGAPAYDPAFGCADFYVLLGVDRVNPRYLKHFLES
ncbi:GNAT family N-acetyltransferase [Allorhizocola rhizosphaerae]|uniref:GNAT family N-acetyltransferase n=1 Tax=Allorhizocola rhizosphaerae TaxID=1872709 RepID=UPI000E3CBA7E|nr:GNAT family N-acyltransferase [Allorhizocola rhizosphaerae]